MMAVLIARLILVGSALLFALSFAETELLNLQILNNVMMAIKWNSTVAIRVA